MYRYIKLIFVKKNIDFDRNIKKIILYLVAKPQIWQWLENLVDILCI
jgi:hypothetical protein